MAPRELFLIRHGKAVEAAPGGDPARPLTDEGARDVAAVGQALRALGVVADAVWHSPYVRATQTAELVARGLACAKLVAEGALTPVASAERAAQAIVGCNARCLVVVSHMPLLPALAHELVGARVDFGTGTVARIAMLGPHGSVLVGLWSAEMLARVR